jgi:hypothetical protein
LFAGIKNTTVHLQTEGCLRSGYKICKTAAYMQEDSLNIEGLVGCISLYASYVQAAIVIKIDDCQADLLSETKPDTTREKGAKIFSYTQTIASFFCCLEHSFVVNCTP